MTRAFHHLSKAAIAVSLVTCGLMSVAQTKTTINAVMHSPLRVLDPIITTAHITRNHGYMIYDTLLATDKDNKIRPQMVQDWKASDDGRTYTFKLRDGLKWHDGAAVTAEDCVASIKRWATQDKMGQLLTSEMTGMKVVDASTFQISMKEPSDLAVRALAKPSGVAPFMMPKRIADTPPTQAITQYIGSGPFKMVMAEFKPGVQVVYEKNTDYVPRAEPASGLAGGKKVLVDRVKWIATPDAMTSVNALANGEVDYLEQVPFDLEPIVSANKDIIIKVLDPQGYQTVMRMNFLHAPFNNKKIRQAAMYAVGQEPVLQAVVGNPKYYKTCAAVFGCEGPYASQEGADVTIKANPKKAQELLKEAGYDGTPVVILQPTDTPSVNSQPVVIGQALRAAGFKVEMQAMDWQTVVTRRAVQAPVKEGGWNIFATNNVMAEASDPLRAFGVAANGKGAWFGWPDVPEIERLRVAFSRTPDEAKRKEFAGQIQKLVIDEGVLLPMGQYYVPAAYRKSLSGALESPVPVFWNIQKK
ncbi:peptide/nickel transport system substrate-binding protein [Acidovorax temperans]|uniref:Peptide/nickel transport system substrate-binding protein n=2 Tax=Acidovorax temperans TaxID=80878 RepID=A0A543KWJ0_9BURK|nr:ABC transporter substrate-binding protein [Acidovorax temperans]TQM99437.1 peptide/nickel transport system substrate-binding protein [Acidovorax temperans]